MMYGNTINTLYENKLEIVLKILITICIIISTFTITYMTYKILSENEEIFHKIFQKVKLNTWTMSGNTKNLKDNTNNLQQMVRSTTDNQVKTSIPITIVVLILALIPFIISLALIFKDAPTQYNIKFTLIRPRSMLYYKK